MNDKPHNPVSGPGTDPGDARLDLLFAAARQTPPDTARAELGFETRLIARLRDARSTASPWFIWSWRLTPLFAAIVLLLAVVDWMTPAVTPAEWETALTCDIESPVVMLWEVEN